ncbi:MAG: ATP-binding protein [Oscillospiraceae bacterium]|nr:ATP-binding protein [Oscillospiraceae bacterium]
MNICAAAENEIKKRRLLAEDAHERRRGEAYFKIPEIREIELRIAQTNSELVKLVINKKGDAEFNRIKQQNLQAQAMIDGLLKKNGFPSDWLSPPYTCNKCADSGFFEGRRCVCFEMALKKLSVQRLNEAANMPKHDFEHFSLDYYKGVKTANGGDCYSVMSDIYDYCTAYADDFSRHSDNLLFYGKTGLGKTHLSLSIAKTAAEKGYCAAYGSLQNYLSAIEKEHFGRAEPGEDTMRTLIEADLLIIDDFGSEFLTDFHESKIYNLINTRINRGLPTIISTNLTKEQLQSRYNDRIISRLFGEYQYFFFVGQDIRQVKRMNS